MQYFGSNIVEGVAESWVETVMSWVEVDGRFSNTHEELVVMYELIQLNTMSMVFISCQYIWSFVQG